MPLTQPQLFRGNPSASARRTYPVGRGEVMKRLLRSTGVCPPANRTSTGIVGVNPTREMSVPPDEEEVDQDDRDEERPERRPPHVLVHRRLPLGEFRIARDGHQGPRAEEGDCQVFPPHEQGGGEARPRGETATG